MKVMVKVMPRKEVLDSQGRAVEETLQRLGFKMDQVRVGKCIELEVGGSKEEALAEAKKIAEKVLHNPLIETFEVVVMA